MPLVRDSLIRVDRGGGCGGGGAGTRSRIEGEMRLLSSLMKSVEETFVANFML